MSDSNYHIGDYTVKTTGNLDHSCEGEVLSINAKGLEGRVLITAEQCVGICSGGALASIDNNEPDAGKITLGVGELGVMKLKSGPPVGGVTLRLDGPELLEMAVGEPGAGSSITMTPESITFKVAETTLTISPGGIVEDVAEVTREVSAEGHNFSAAETEFNIGVQGVTREGPTDANEVEGGTLENETLGSHTTDALKNEDAGIAMEI
jgi:hypothetical protein